MLVRDRLRSDLESIHGGSSPVADFDVLYHDLSRNDQKIAQARLDTLFLLLERALVPPLYFDGSTSEDRTYDVKHEIHESWVRRARNYPIPITRGGVMRTDILEIFRAQSGNSPLKLVRLENPGPELDSWTYVYIPGPNPYATVEYVSTEPDTDDLTSYIAASTERHPSFLSCVTVRSFDANVATAAMLTGFVLGL